MIQPAGFPKLPSDWDYETEVHESLDREHTIFFNVFKKRNIEPKRALLIIHGLGEHGARYQHFPHYLQQHYDLIIAPDLRGHGRSEGVRGHVESFDEYVDDAMLAWNVLEQKTQKHLQSTCERDWFGHSMGGLVTLRSLLYRPETEVDRIILSSPCLSIKVAIPPVKKVAVSILNKIWGSLQFDNEVDAKQVSHDPAVVEAYIRDRLNHSKATPRFFSGFVDSMIEVLDSDMRVRKEARILIQAAGEDSIVDTEVAKLFFEKLRHDDKKLIVYPGMYHEIYNELNKEHVFDDWKAWAFKAEPKG